MISTVLTRSALLKNGGVPARIKKGVACHPLLVAALSGILALRSIHFFQVQQAAWLCFKT